MLLSRSFTMGFGVLWVLWHPAFGQTLFKRGDANGDSAVNTGDPVTTLNALFLGGAGITCDDAADSNDDGVVSITDAVNTLLFLFVGNADIPTPGPNVCGEDLTEDTIGCAEYASCRGLRSPLEDGVRVLADKVDILKPIDPTLLNREVSRRSADLVYLESLNDDRFLVYESESRAIESVSFCPNAQACFAELIEPVALHYSASGLARAQGAPQASISKSVPSIRLQSGWVLSYDANTRSILGFKEQAPVNVVDDLGNDRELGYRVAPRDSLNRPDIDNLNFGQGNGLVLSEVMTGERLIDAVGVNVITRMFEIESNKVLLFFGQTLPAIHLLEISEARELRDWDVETPADPDSPAWDEIETEVIRGRIQVFPVDPLDPVGPRSRPFLTYRTIAERVTQDAVVRVDEMQPVIVPQDPPSALLYDAQTFSFMKVTVARDVAGLATGGIVRTAVSGEMVLATLRQSTEIMDPAGPFAMGDALLAPDATEIWIMEEETDNLLSYDYSQDPTSPSVLSVRLPSSRFRQILDPQGPRAAVDGPEVDLVFGTSDVRGNRLVFDRQSDRILSIHYATGNVAVVARQLDLTLATGDTLAEILLTAPLDETNVRLFDAQSMALIELRLRYTPKPEFRE